MKKGNNLLSLLKTNLPPDPLHQRVHLFTYVSNLPYQINGATTPEQVLEAGAGYCVSKHRLLKELFEEIGIMSKFCFVPFCFGDIFLPDHLKGWGMATKNWYHVFLESEVEGESIFIDASFGEAFSVTYPGSGSRDGTSSMTLFGGPYSEMYRPKDQAEESGIKKKLQGETVWDEDDEKRIEQFNDWVMQIHSSTPPPLLPSA